MGFDAGDGSWDWIEFSYITMDELRTALSEDAILEPGEIEDIITEVDTDHVRASFLTLQITGGWRDRWHTYLCACGGRWGD